MMIIFSVLILAYAIYEIIKKYKASRHPKIRILKAKLALIDPRSKDVNLYEDPDYAYIVNKQDIYIVIQDKKGNYYDDNTLMHVLLHELAHAINKSIGHDEKFYELFNKLKVSAQEYGYYNPSLPLDRNYPIKKGE